MSEKRNVTPDGTPMIDSLAEETFGGLSIDPIWFELPEGESLDSDGDEVTVSLLMYGERGQYAKRLQVRLVIEEVEDLEQ